MKGITKKIIAAAAAAAMTITAVGLSAYADKTNGWVKEDGVSRRYSSGSPYTGWLKNKDGSKKYVLDGYLVKGYFTIGSKTYNFGEDGTYTGEKFTPPVIGECKDDILPTTDKITVTISTTDNSGKKYGAAEPYKMERWEKGLWVDCMDESSMYGVDDVSLGVSYEKGNTGTFYPQAYTGNNFSEGYYRITFPAWEEENREGTWHIVYTVFQVTSGKSGWVKEDGINRRYNNGKPYTGWIKGKDGAKKYCLDGYLATGDMQIGDSSYSFDKDGNLTGQTPLAISADVGGKIKAGTKNITIKLTKITDIGTQNFGAPVLLERWEKGQWVDCFADLDGNVPMTMELYSMNYKGETFDLPFRSLASTGYKLTPGFYRIPINDVTDTSIKFANPVAVLSEDGTVTPVTLQSPKADSDVEFASAYAMFEVVAK
ncbi:MAG: hypothetical protein J1E40_00095 [Oscillospiraceae bacterium]|nr:hypothetical protein [Oscillospiraceae bacterium]